MAHFFGIANQDEGNLDKEVLSASILLEAEKKQKTFSDGELYAELNFHLNEPDSGRYFSDSQMVLMVGGNPLIPANLTLEKMSRELAANNYTFLEQLRGYFTLAFLDKGNARLLLISDQISHMPVFYSQNAKSFTFSTHLSTFTVLPQSCEFDEKWLYELLFFNYALGEQTFLKNVHRMPPSSVATWDLKERTLQIEKYKELPKRSEILLSGKEGLKQGIEAYKRVLPMYSSDPGKYLHAVTGGLDARALLSQASESADITTYTYGTREGKDLSDVALFLKNMDLKHWPIYFEDAFEENLPQYMHDTVRLSGGMQSIARSTLPYVYKHLQERSEEIPVFVSGIMSDGLIRGQLHTPTVISRDAKDAFLNGPSPSLGSSYEEVLTGDFNDFRAHILSKLDHMENTYGPGSSSEAHLNYEIYEVAPKYFVGELCLANNVGIFRSPYMDHELVDLAFRMEFSMLTYSNLIHKKPNVFAENLFQACLMAENPSYSKALIEGIPMKYWAHHYRMMPRILMQYQRAITRFKRSREKFSPLEDWSRWFWEILKPHLEDLILKDSRLQTYISKDYIQKAMDTRNQALISRLVTAELILRLINNGWKKTY